MKVVTLYLLLYSLPLISLSQPVFNDNTINNFDFGTVHHLLLKDADNRIAYVMATDSMPLNYQFYLLKTTDGGLTWVEITTFPSGFTPNKFLQVGDTIIGVGNQIWRSENFGDTWSQLTVPSAGEEYEDIRLLPGNNVWINGVKSNSNNYYQCDLSFASYTLKYSVATNFAWYKKKTQLSTFSSDTIYFMQRDLSGGYAINVTYDNGLTWNSKPFNMDSLYQILGDSTSVPIGTARVSLIQYNNSMHANIFSFSSGAAHDFVTNDGFNTVSIDTFDLFGHNSHEAVKWITCGSTNYLAYDANEDSNYGLQEVSHNSVGELVLGADYFGLSMNLVQLNDIAFASGASELHTSLITSLCTSVIGLQEVEIYEDDIVHPLISHGQYEIKAGAFNHCTWSAFNMFGQVVASGAYPGNTIDLTAESNGIYIIALNSGLKWFKEKVVKY